MKDVLELIIKNLVEKKDEISITENIENNVTVFTVKVASTDMGRVIGKEGKIANAIRTLIKSLANVEKKRVSIQFVD